MNKDLMIFNNNQFGQIRAIEKDGQTWFIGKDIAERLGYAKPSNAISNHVDEDDTLKQGITDSLGRIQQTTLINESGLYSLILSSKLPTSKQFKHWVTSEVLPSIRKNGSYTAQPKALSPLEQLRVQYQVLEEHQEQLNEMSIKVNKLENTMTIDYGQQQELHTLANRSVIKVLGGKDTPAYKELSKKTFSTIWRDFKRVMNVSSYRNTAVKEFERAVEIIKTWKPNRELHLMIKGANSQLILDVE